MNIAQATIVIRTTDGATHKVVFNGDGVCVSGDEDTLMPALGELLFTDQDDEDEHLEAELAEDDDQSEGTEPASAEESTKPATPLTMGWGDDVDDGDR
jgi:hypothetical protein